MLFDRLCSIYILNMNTSNTRQRNIDTHFDFLVLHFYNLQMLQYGWHIGLNRYEVQKNGTAIRILHSSLFSQDYRFFFSIKFISNNFQRDLSGAALLFSSGHTNVK